MKQKETYVNKFDTFSLCSIISGCITGATSYIAFEKFIEGRYDVSFVIGSISALSGLMSCLGYIKGKEHAERINDENERNEFVIKQLHDELNPQNVQADLEQKCQSYGNVIPISRALISKKGRGPKNPAA